MGYGRYSISSGYRYAIIMLAARDTTTDRVVGLEMGADDYVGKPFDGRELLARARAVLRRAHPIGPPRRRAGSLELDEGARRVTVAGAPVTLTAKEFDILAALMSANGRVLARTRLYALVWGVNEGLAMQSRTVDVHVAHLRRALGPEAHRVVTVKGVGYQFLPDGQA